MQESRFSLEQRTTRLYLRPRLVTGNEVDVFQAAIVLPHLGTERHQQMMKDRESWRSKQLASPLLLNQPVRGAGTAGTASSALPSPPQGPWEPAAYADEDFPARRFQRLLISTLLGCAASAVPPPHQQLSVERAFGRRDVFHWRW